MERILVIGGTGRLGQPVVKTLAKAGYEVRLMTRRGQVPSALQGLSVVPFQGDLRHPEHIAQALSAVQAVYIHLPEAPSAQAEFIPEVHGIQNLLSVLPKDVLILKMSEIDAAENPHLHNLSFKYRSEERIKQSGNPFIIFRPTWFMESLPLILQQGKRVFYIGRQSHPMYWIAGEDYARQVLSALRQSNTLKQHTFNVQGREAFTFTQAVQHYVQASAQGFSTGYLPLWTLRLGGWFSAEQQAHYELLRHYNQRYERFISAETWRLLGEPQLTLEQFARTWHAPIV